ncbi:MAG: glycerate kinase, partial [Clostridia bacterium]|nr:glycerate kinase [Clostridia bacterium]
GVGELILDAKENGAERILLGLGGSATNDCGFGMASALGYMFTDKNGKELIPMGKTMIDVERITKPEKALELPVTAACDVENPLYGKNGAAFVFAPQKGADKEAVLRLDTGLRHISDIIYNDLKINISDIKGAGAAGGMGGGAVAFLNAVLKKGIDIILDKADFDKKVQNADIVITGEGRLDFQSVNGKVISGVAERAARLNKKVIAICGSRGDGAEKIRECGVSEMYFACEKEKSFDEIIKNCRYDLYNASVKAAKSQIKN